MSNKKEDKLFIRLKNYNQEREALLQLAIEKRERGEELTEEEAKAIVQHFPTDKELAKMTGKMSELSKTLGKIVQPQMEIVDTITKNIEEITKPLTDSINSVGKGLQKALQPVFDELDNQNKENPLTRKEIETGNKFFDEYIKEKKNLIEEIELLNTKQNKLLSNIFEETRATEEDIVKYKLESEEIDLPSNIFNDISKKIKGNETTNEIIEREIEQFIRINLSEKTRKKLEKVEKEEDLKKALTDYERKKLDKMIRELEDITLVFDNRPSRLELGHIEIDREIKKQKPFKYLFYKATKIPFENISEENFKKYLTEEIELLKKAIAIRKTINSRNREILRIFSRASNPYFEGKKEEEISESDRKLKEDFYNTSFLFFQNSTQLEKLFTQIFLKRTSYDELDLERQERFFEFLNYTLEELEDLQKEWNKTQNEVEEVVEQYLSTNSKNKLLTTEKIVPQIMLSGEKIEKLFKDKESGKIEKVTFDLSSGDSNKNFIIHFLMKEYPLTFNEDTFKTLESLMTIQNQMEKQFGTLKGIKFDTKYVLYLNKGGRVTNYSKDLIQKTNRELISLMSAIGSLDTTEFFLKYYNLDEETIVDENEAIFENVTNEKEWNKKIEEIRKEKMRKLPEDKQFPFDKIKKISTLQPFVSLKGLNIESEEEAYNNTFWKFNDIDEKPIPLFEILKITGRFASLPLEMDSYLTDSTKNNEITRILKTIIANLNYFKSNKGMKKDKTKKNFLEYYFEGTRIIDDEGNKIKNPKKETFEPFEAMQLLKQKKLIGEWKYKTTRTIDSIAKDCKFDEERGIGIPKKWKDNKERPLFVDSIIYYLRKAKEDKNIDDFILYTTKDRIVQDKEYITKNEKRNKNTKEKVMGKTTKAKTKQRKNPTIEKISIIIK